MDALGAIEHARVRLLAGIDGGDERHLPAPVRRTLRVARAVGAPALPALDAIDAAERDRQQLARALDVATAQARAVAAGLAALPVLAVAGIGALLGEPLWRFYLSGAGVVVGVVGAGLALLGVGVALWLVRSVGRQRRPRRAGPTVLLTGIAGTLLAGVWAGVAAAVLAGIVRARRPPPRVHEPDADEVADLLATALGGGVPPAAALRLVADALPARAADLRRAALAVELGLAAQLPGGLAAAGALLDASSRFGAPAAPALRRLASQLRAERLDHARAAAERLPALLAFPTALCLLPACVLLAGAPLVASGLEAVGAGR